MTMPITAALTALYAELAEEIPDVLTESFTFAGLWADLCRIAGEPVPRDVAAVLDAPLDLVPSLPISEALAPVPEFPRGNRPAVPALEQFTRVNPLVLRLTERSPHRGSYAAHADQFAESYAD